MVAPGTCNNIQERCILGTYCTGASDTCSGICHASCFKCSGPSASDCTQCSPLFKGGSKLPIAGSCGGGNLIFVLFFYSKIF